MPITDGLPTPPLDDPTPAPANSNDPKKSDKPAAPDKMALMAEAHKRGLLSPEKAGLYNEALKRGLLPGASASDTGTSPAPIKEVGKELFNAGAAGADELRQGLYDLEGRDRAVDYGPGAGFATEAALKEADNPAESKATLEKIYGKGKAGQDREGNWWVEKNGKKVAVFGDKSSVYKRLGTSAMSEAPEMAGMSAGEVVGGAIGTAAGLESGPGAFATGAAGMAIGGAVGKGGQDLWKWAHGTLRKTGREEEHTLESNALFSLGGAAVGKTLTRLGGYLLRPKELPWVHITPEMEKRTSDALAHGMVPRVEQATGGKTYRLFIMDQKLMHYVWGDPNVEKNVSALNSQLESTLKSAGVAPDKIDSTMKQIVSRDVPPDDVNGTIVKAVTDYRDGLQKIAADGAEKAKKTLDLQLSDIDKSLKDPKISLAEGVENDIATARKNFSETAGGLYQTADELAAGRKLVEGGDIKETVQGILDRIPKTAGTPATENYVRDARGILRKQTAPAQPGTALGTQVDTPVMSYIRDMLKLPDKITMADASRIRSSLLELTRNPGLTPGVGWKELQDIAKSVDVSIDKVALSTEDKPVVDALKTANDFYRDGIAKFKDVTAARLVKEAGQRGAVEPEKVMDAIIRPGNVTQAKRLMGFLQPDTKHQLARDYFQSIVKDATDPLNPEKLSGARLLRYVNKNADMMKAVLGPDAFKQISTLAKNTAALDESIPISELGQDGGATAVKKALETRKAFDSFMNDNYLRELAKPGADKDRALEYIIRPGHIEKLKNAVALFGKNSPVMTEVRQTLMTKILSSSIGESGDPAEQMFAGTALKDSLTHYGRGYIEEAFGKEMSDDLFRLGDAVAVISSKPKIGGAVGFVAGVGIMLHPLHHLGKLVGLHLMNNLMSSPAFIKWLIFGIKGDSMAIKTVNQMVRQAVNLAAQGAIPNSSEESPADQRKDALSPSP